jgi:hypothetical protein
VKNPAAFANQLAMTRSAERSLNKSTSSSKSSLNNFKTLPRAVVRNTEQKNKKHVEVQPISRLPRANLTTSTPGKAKSPNIKPMNKLAPYAKVEEDDISSQCSEYENVEKVDKPIDSKNASVANNPSLNIDWRPIETELIAPAAYHQHPVVEFDAILSSLEKAAQSVQPYSSCCINGPIGSDETHDLARKLRANPDHLRDNCDYVEFWDLDNSHLDVDRIRCKPTSKLFAKNSKPFKKSNSSADFGNVPQIKPVLSNNQQSDNKFEIKLNNKLQLRKSFSNGSANYYTVPRPVTTRRPYLCQLRAMSDQSANASVNGDEEFSPPNHRPAHQRSLSLPKSFLSDRYGINGFRAALPGLV